MFFKKKSNKNDLAQGVSKTRKSLFGGLGKQYKENTQEIIEDLENRFLTADIGIKVTDEILGQAQNKLKTKSSLPDWIVEIKSKMLDILLPVQIPLEISEQQPFVILVVGVNGAGKTTTIGKMARQFTSQGKSVILAAGDTFRAAAVEQLKQWGERNQVKVMAQEQGADSASVIYDTIASAKSKKIDVVICDTAGRLHTQDNLMAELSKIHRVIKKHNIDYPHETMLVLDSGVGQNALVQVKAFNDIVQLTGLTITKLDGTAKGGIILALAKLTKLPIRYIGIGESVTDLKQFSAAEFVDAIVEVE